MNENYDSLNNSPSLELTTKAIKKLENFDWPQFNSEIHQNNVEDFIKEIDEVLTKEFNIFPSLLQPIKIKDFKLNIFRAREVSTFQNINIFSEHLYPPPYFTGMGRCNFPKNPVFYGANHPGTALFEVIGDKDFSSNQFCIAKWEIKESKLELFLENYLRNNLPEENIFQELNSNLTDKLDKTFKRNLDSDKKKALIKYLSFLDDCFINDSNYSLSAALAYRAIFRKHFTRTDILIYPSKQSLLKGVNFAVNPNFASNYLYIKRFYIVTVNSINKELGQFNISFNNYGVVERGLTIWNKITKKDNTFESLVIEDFGQSFYENLLQHQV